MKRLLILLLALPLALVIACSQGEPPVPTIDLMKKEAVPEREKKAVGAVRIAVGAMITPKEGFVYYREFLDYLAEKIGRPVEYVDATNYESINSGLRDGSIDAGFVCSGPYVDGKEQFGLELLAMPQAYGKTVYHAYIIVPKESRATELASLKGKSFAFTDPMSNTGCLVPRYMVSKLGSTPDAFFSKTTFTGAHDTSIKAVAEGLVDGASVDSLIWEYANRMKPADTSRTKIVAISDPWGIPPFVVRPGIDPALRKALSDALLSAHADPKGAVLLGNMAIGTFVTPDDRAYDSVRAMKKRLAKEPAKKTS